MSIDFIDVLLDAYTSAFGPDDDVCLVIKSTGASTVYEHNAIDDQIRALAANPSVAEIELITDELSREDMAALYRSCDALVHPYRGVGFGLPIAEAMACGLPVVAARATGSASIVKHGQTGYLVSPGAISLFADDLDRYCRDPDLRAAHGAAARAESGAYQWDAINQSVADTYLRLIRQKTRRRG